VTELCEETGRACVWRVYGPDPHVRRGLAPFLSVTPMAAILSNMKRVTALEAKTRFGEVLEAAQRQPVSITRNGRPSVVMISAESYERRQRMARERLRQSLQHAGEHAAAQGMNEDVLDQLLADES
jgi:prevent-host-death family protein